MTRPPVPLEFTLTVTVDPEAYLAEYGDYGRIEQIGERGYARELLTDLLYAALPEHLRPIVQIEKPGEPVDPPATHAATILRLVRAALENAYTVFDEQQLTRSLVLIGAAEYEDGWFFSARTGACELYYAGRTGGVSIDVEPKDEADDEALNDALTAFAGRVAPGAILAVDLLTGDVDYELDGRVYQMPEEHLL